MPSEISKLSAREASICARLLEIRHLLGLEQTDVAKILGISRDRYASYEQLRAPLRYELGDRLCAALDINQRWLATGQLPRLQYQEVSDAHRIAPRTLFSKAYDSTLKLFIENSLKDAATVMGHYQIEDLDLHLVSNNEWKIRRSKNTPSIDPGALQLPLLTATLKAAFEELKPEQRSVFYRHVCRSISEFLPRHFLILEGGEKGPFSIEELQRLLAERRLQPNTIVRTESQRQPLIKLLSLSNYRSVAKLVGKLSNTG